MLKMGLTNQEPLDMQSKRHFTTKNLSKISDFLASPTLIVLSESQWKKQKWVSSLPKSLQERVRVAASRLKTPLEAGGRLCVTGQSAKEEDLWIALLPQPKEKSNEAFFLLEFARDSLKLALQPAMVSFRLVLIDDASVAADSFGAALAARAFLMPVYGKREKKQKPWQLNSFELVSAQGKDLKAFEYGYATGGGSNLARYLATLPPNILTAETYSDWIKEICKENGITFKFHSKTELKKMGAGSFTAVDQGNPDSAGGIYELSYSPKGKSKRTIHLAGKGLCFDTGGYDIKIGGGMHTMKGDMQGSAVALATMVTAIRLKLPYKMKAFLGVTENHISPQAYKADEVITALNGLSIEVINTDAEGRMVLADVLTLASRGKPDCLIDFATLTGSAVRSIGTKYSAGFTNREDLHDEIKAAGRKSGERVWTFPIDSVYAKSLESKVADTLQCSRTPGVDHILAACFLSRFVEGDTPWVHIDLSAAENDSGIGHVDSLFTGFGVRWAIEFMKTGL
jgi:leucyl aminopeptidase